jgi:hypothetical protein
MAGATMAAAKVTAGLMVEAALAAEAEEFRASFQVRAF